MSPMNPVDYYVAAILHAIEQIAPVRSEEAQVAVLEEDVAGYYTRSGTPLEHISPHHPLYEEAADKVLESQKIRVETRVLVEEFTL